MALRGSESDGRCKAHRRHTDQDCLHDGCFFGLHKLRGNGIPPCPPIVKVTCIIWEQAHSRIGPELTRANSTSYRYGGKMEVVKFVTLRNTKRKFLKKKKRFRICTGEYHCHLHGSNRGNLEAPGNSLTFHSGLGEMATTDINFKIIGQAYQKQGTLSGMFLCRCPTVNPHSLSPLIAQVRFDSSLSLCLHLYAQMHIQHNSCAV